MRLEGYKERFKRSLTLRPLLNDHGPFFVVFSPNLDKLLFGSTIIQLEQLDVPFLDLPIPALRAVGRSNATQKNRVAFSSCGSYVAVGLGELDPDLPDRSNPTTLRVFRLDVTLQQCTECFRFNTDSETSHDLTFQMHPFLPELVIAHWTEDYVEAERASNSDIVRNVIQFIDFRQRTPRRLDALAAQIVG